MKEYLGTRIDPGERLKIMIQRDKIRKELQETRGDWWELTREEKQIQIKRLMKQILEKKNGLENNG